jgi:hypothetical protein
MTRLMLSYLSQKYGALPLATFRTQFADHSFVWEPGGWRPPSKGGSTVVAAPIASASTEAGKTKAGDTLAILLRPKEGQSELTLGRESTADLVVDDGTVSARHLLLQRDGEGWLARNPGSTNGTWVNNERLAEGLPRPLKSGDRVTIGSVNLTYYDPKGLYFRLKSG